MEVENDKMKSTGERIKALLNEKKMTSQSVGQHGKEKPDAN